MAKPVSIEVWNPNGKYRVVSTKSMPGTRWINLLIQQDVRLEICTEKKTILSVEDIIALIGDKCDGVIGQLTEDWGEELFSALSKAGGKAFSNMAVGYNNVDVNAANKYGVAVGNTPRLQQRAETPSRKPQPQAQTPVIMVSSDPREEVLQAWYMDDSNEDQRLPHHKEPKEFVSLDQLAELGVLSWKLDADNPDTDPELKKIREERGYSYLDVCEISPEKLPNYDEKIRSFFEEHLHIDEEIRYAVAGSGYFDVRDRNEAWIRVWVKKGGMIILPAGIYHRFTLDEGNYIKALRFFVGEPVWTPYNRPHDHLPARGEYIKNFVEKDVANHTVDATA